MTTPTVYNLFKDYSTACQYSATNLTVTGTEDKRILFRKFHEYNPIERASDFSIFQDAIPITTQEGYSECMGDTKCKLFLQKLLRNGFNVDLKK